METAAIAIVALLALGLWCDNWRLRKENAAMKASRDGFSSLYSAERERTATLDAEVLELLRQKHQPAPKSDIFADRDKIPATGPRRYESIATRRARAEKASMGPATHDAQVRENNARAMEQAG